MAPSMQCARRCPQHLAHERQVWPSVSKFGGIRFRKFLDFFGACAAVQHGKFRLAESQTSRRASAVSLQVLSAAPGRVAAPILIAGRQRAPS